jgi:hypothetical protein
MKNPPDPQPVPESPPPDGDKVPDPEFLAWLDELL